MKNTLLIDFDSKIPNLALMKLSTYFKRRGNVVGFDVVDPDYIYCSVIFPKNKQQAAGLQTMFPGVPITFGGTGWDIRSKLPKEIELLKPDYDLYPSEYSQGFTTRGCIRRCSFCFVPEKEGNMQIAQHPSEFHDDRFKICMLMDNNFLAAPKHWILTVLDWFKSSGVKMDMCQGFDARLLTEDIAGSLKDIRHKTGVRFAWDHTHDEDIIVRAIGYLKDSGFNLKHDVSFYVLAGYDTGFEDALYRCNRLREMGVNSFVMPYHKRDKNINKLAKWANRRWSYWAVPFETRVIS
jgi:hypothetical protein